MLFFLLAALAFAADDSPKVQSARQELVRVREQAAAGLVASAKIVEAQASLDDAVDEDVLNRTLYAHLEIEDLNERQATEMTGAAERRVARIEAKVAHGKQLVAAGVAEPYLFADLEKELARRREVVSQAKNRASLVMQIVAMANSEAEVSESAPGVWLPKEHVDGDHLLEPSDIKAVTLAFEKQFHEPFPISARGDTAVHRSMGFDHTGRIDVAVTPDSPEGVWLRKYLESKSIPYYAFRVAMAGKATAPHIHIGPASTRFHTD